VVAYLKLSYKVQQGARKIVSSNLLWGVVEMKEQGDTLTRVACQPTIIREKKRVPILSTKCANGRTL